MMSFNTRFKAAILAVTMLTAGQVSALSLSSFVPNSPKKVAALILLAMWIRLQTKGSNFDYTMSDWSEDQRKLLKHDLFAKKLYRRLVKLFDKYAIGRAVSINDVHYRSKSEDGTMIVTKKDSYLKTKPFGAMGLFDAYVICMLKKIGEIGTNWDKAEELFGKLESSL